jgi:hypothetical protein
LVNWLRALHLGPARSACLNPPAMPLLMRSVESARPLVLARSVDWTCLNHRVVPLLMRLEPARALALARSVNWAQLKCLNPLATPLLALLVHSLGALHLGPARSACLNPPAMPLLMRSVEAARALLLARSVDWTRRSERLNLLRSCRASAHRCPVDRVNR